MRTTPIRMSESALVQMTGMLGLKGKWLLPEGEGGAKNFLKARKEWEEAGLARLDFDGELHLEPRMARLIYNMTHAQAAALYEDGEQKVLLLKGPVDVLLLEYIREEESWELALRPFHETAEWLRSLAEVSSPGRLLTLRAGEDEPVCRELDEGTEDGQNCQRRQSLADGLADLFGRPKRAALPEPEKEEEKDAGNSHCNDSV